ncbi:MAG: stage II sporulation protein R [Firmicutes bacterium]|nr:stage II sporulation protein R [Bacillota bacterium]
MKFTFKKLFFITIAALFMTSAVMNIIEKSEIEQGISSKVVRFHIRAESNSEYDQKLKLLVRDDVLAEAESILAQCKTREECLEVLSENIEIIEKAAQESVHKNGGNAEVTAEIKKEIFPLKTYGNITFPAGQYTALVIEIGGGKGRNWWCVMFPKLCFVEESVVKGENTEKQLSLILSEDEYDEVMRNNDFEIGFKFAEIIGSIF